MAGNAVDQPHWRNTLTDIRPDEAPKIGDTFSDGPEQGLTVTDVWRCRFGDWKVSFANGRGGGGFMSLDRYLELQSPKSESPTTHVHPGASTEELAENWESAGFGSVATAIRDLGQNAEVRHGAKDARLD